MSKKSHHFLTLWPWPLTYDLEKLIRSGHYHYQCVYQIWEQSIPWFLVIAFTPLRAAGGGRLRRKTITSPDPLDTGDIIKLWLRLSNKCLCHVCVHPLFAGLATWGSILLHINTTESIQERDDAARLPWQISYLTACITKITWTNDDPVHMSSSHVPCVTWPQLKNVLVSVVRVWEIIGM